MDLLPLVFVQPILFAAAVSDLRHLRISNKLSLMALGLFIVCCPFLPFDEVVSRLLYAGIIFVFGFSLFTFHIVGGGDVKILSALVLFIPSISLILFAYVFSACLLVGIVLMIGLRSFRPNFATDWASIQQGRTLPMGISIAMAAIFQLYFLLAVVQ
ncbi:Type IV leader peptidase family protein [Roseovarius albus]|uniref:Type IV leader peptidase family protein n=2 Tax=Roseovarius albus TaxID=1247867 RepID=A0A1X7A9J6_9RHOB|nr:Type IV leader peptidase family protein [Roseovarius albus]